MSSVHCQLFPNCMALGEGNTMPSCGKSECPGRLEKVRAADFCAKLGQTMAEKPEPTSDDDETMAEMRAQLWAAGLDLEESAFIARMLFRNGQRIVKATAS